MIIESATLKEFQCHKKLDLKFTDGLNIVCGDSGEGKTAIIRAFNLLFHNEPRGGEKLFKRIGGDNPIEITIRDTNGNIVTRSNKKYVLNGETLKAFKTEVPEPITRLFPLKPINWFRQLDKHFLILDTPGNAAKLLQKTIGMQEQEKIIKKVKSRLTETKSIIKVSVRSIEDYEDQIKLLKPVKELKKRSSALVKKRKTFDDDLSECEALRNLLNKIISIDNELESVADFTKYLVIIEKLIFDLHERNDFENSVEELSDALDDIKGIVLIDSKTIDCATKDVKKYIGEANDLSEIEDQLCELKGIIESISTIDDDLASLDSEIKALKKEEKEILSSFKLCPFCKKPV